MQNDHGNCVITERFWSLYRSIFVGWPIQYNNNLDRVGLTTDRAVLSDQLIKYALFYL